MSMDMGTNWLDFSGKVSLVTGAATGRGLATARAFAASGAAVVLRVWQAGHGLQQCRRDAS